MHGKTLCTWHVLDVGVELINVEAPSQILAILVTFLLSAVILSAVILIIIKLAACYFIRQFPNVPTVSQLFGLTKVGRWSLFGLCALFSGFEMIIGMYCLYKKLSGLGIIMYILCFTGRMTLAIFYMSPVHVTKLTTVENGRKTNKRPKIHETKIRTNIHMIAAFMYLFANFYMAAFLCDVIVLVFGLFAVGFFFCC